MILLTRGAALEAVVATILSMIEQSCDRWELVIVEDGQSSRLSAVIDAFAALDRRIGFDDASAAASDCDMAVAGYDLAQGDYLGLVASGDQIAREAVEEAVAVAKVKGRPEILNFPAGLKSETSGAAQLYLIRADALAKAGLFSEVDPVQGMAGVAGRALEQGARRVDVILEPGARPTPPALCGDEA
jgi:glycosyltransferase involved in cell wall biosynthesis